MLLDEINQFILSEVGVKVNLLNCFLWDRAVKKNFGFRVGRVVVWNS